MIILGEIGRNYTKGWRRDVLVQEPLELVHYFVSIRMVGESATREPGIAEQRQRWGCTKKLHKVVPTSQYFHILSMRH